MGQVLCTQNANNIMIHDCNDSILLSDLGWFLYFYINVLIYMLLYLYFLTFTIMLLYYVGSDHKVKRSHKKKLATAAPPISSMLQCVMIYYYTSYDVITE